MFRDVVPAVWSEVGAQVRGSVSKAGTRLEYAAYVVNGLGVKDPSEMPDELVRSLRDNTIDNNLDKGVGARLGATVARGEVGETTLGVSTYTGAIDADRRLTILDADLTTKLAVLTINGEVAQTYLDGKSYNRGAYAAAAYAVGRTTLVARWDYAANRPKQGALVTSQQAVATVKFAPAASWSVRTEASVPLQRPPGTSFQVGLAAMMAFVF
jgi:hypothetical protein